MAAVERFHTVWHPRSLDVEIPNINCQQSLPFSPNKHREFPRCITTVFYRLKSSQDQQPLPRTASIYFYQHRHTDALSLRAANLIDETCCLLNLIILYLVAFVGDRPSRPSVSGYGAVSGDGAMSEVMIERDVKTYTVRVGPNDTWKTSGFDNSYLVVVLPTYATVEFSRVRASAAPQKNRPPGTCTTVQLNKKTYANKSTVTGWGIEQFCATVAPTV